MGRLLTVNQHAMRFHNRIAYHEFKGFEFNLFMRDPLLKDIEGYKVRAANHGLLVLGATIPEAFVMHHFLEFACRGQIAALSAGYENLNFPTRKHASLPSTRWQRKERRARWWQGLARLPTHGRSPIPRIPGIRPTQTGVT